MLVGTWPGRAGEVRRMPRHTGETLVRRPWHGRGGKLGDLILLIGPVLALVGLVGTKLSLVAESLVSVL